MKGIQLVEKVRVAILGSGNIGSDLLVKCIKSNLLELTLFVGRNLSSRGIEFAKSYGINTSIESISGLEKNLGLFDIIFDATSAESHKENHIKYSDWGKIVIDLTPSRVGKSCIPIINASDCKTSKNINMVTCGGQASIPMIHALSEHFKDISYAEVAATISSDSAGMGTRENIDEYTITTQNAIKRFTGIQNVKSILALNPAIPQIIMRNTIYLKSPSFRQDFVLSIVENLSSKIREYVPGYRVVYGPVIENDILKLTIEVEGKGDFLPSYSGNLDIITSAAVRMAELYAQQK